MFTRVLNLTFLSVLLVGELYFFLEPAAIKAQSDSDSVVASLMVTGEITVSSPNDFSITPSIPGVTGNPGAPSSATTTWTVVTAHPTGYLLTLFASQDNALFLGTASDQYFTDYTPASAGTPDYAWASPALYSAEFGFSVASTSAATAFKNNGSSACNTGLNNSTSNCFLDFTTTPGVTIVNRSTNTDGNGETTTVKVLAESNQKVLETGTYSATITATATVQ